MTRPTLLRAAFIALALGTVFTAFTQQNAPPLALHKVADDLYYIEGSGGNVGVYLTDEGPIVIDDKFDRNYDEILANIKKISNKPVKYLINTHHHGDHTGGNPKMISAGVEVLLHKNARANMVNGNQPGVPNVAFDGELQITLGGKEIRARYFGRGHTNGDAVVFFPARRTIHTGDLMAGTSPLIDYRNGGSLLEFTKTLDTLLANDFDTVIPGHGPVHTKADLQTYRDNLGKLQSDARQQIRSGKSKEEFSKYMAETYKWSAMQLSFADAIMAELK